MDAWRAMETICRVTNTSIVLLAREEALLLKPASRLVLHACRGGMRIEVVKHRAVGVSRERLRMWQELKTNILANCAVSAAIWRMRVPAIAQIARLELIAASMG